MKKIILFACLIFCSLSLVSCKSLVAVLEKPSAEVKDFYLDSVSTTGMTLGLVLKVKNPYALNISLAQVKAQALVEGQELLSLDQDEPLVLKKHSQTEVVLLLQIAYQDLYQASNHYLEKEYLAVEAHCQLKVLLPKIIGLPKEIIIPVNVQKEIPTIKPQISLENIHLKIPAWEDLKLAIKRSNLSAFDTATAIKILSDLLTGKIRDYSQMPDNFKFNFLLFCDLKVENTGGAKIKVGYLQYKLFYNENIYGLGQTYDVQEIENGSLLTISNSINYDKISLALGDIFSQQKMNFHMAGMALLYYEDKTQAKPIKFVFGEEFL